LQQTYTHDAAVFARLSVYIKNLNGVVWKIPHNWQSYKY
jgi:hypothetical protein